MLDKKELLESGFIKSPFIANVIDKGVRIFLIVLVGMIIRKVLYRITESYAKKKATQQSYTVMRVLNNLIKYSVVFFIIIGILEVFDVPVKSVLTLASILSVAVGFGAQELVKDVINGLFIIVEEQYAIGDIVEIAGKTGKVEDIDLRKTTLFNGGTGSVYYIPNSQIEVVTNKTKDYQKAIIDFEIPFECDRELALETVQKLVDTYDYQGKSDEQPILHGVTRFSDNGMNIRVTCDCFKGEGYGVEKELRLLMKDQLEAVGIEMPYNTSTVIINND